VKNKPVLIQRKEFRMAIRKWEAKNTPKLNLIIATLQSISNDKVVNY